MTVKEVIEIKEIMEILNKIEYCKKRCYEKTKDFILSIEKQYIEKNRLTEKQLKALEDIHYNTKNPSSEYEDTWYWQE